MAVHTTTGARRRSPLKLVWMIPGGLALLVGLDAALILLGLPAPLSAQRFAEVHGVLLVLGFLGTLISLERATALGRWFGYAAPALLGLGGILLFVDALPLAVGQWVLVAGTAAFTAIYVPLWRRRYDTPILVQLLAAGLALAAAILWAGGAATSRVLPWLLAFVVLTIAAERVELAAITMGARANLVLLVHAWVVAGALLVGLALPHAGAIVLGLAFVSLTVWLFRTDIARRTIRARGATRFMAASMLAGYFWLFIAGVVLLFGHPTSAAAYDAVTHGVLLGFAISMIMAHATTILPAVLGVTLPYRSIMWIPAVLLHLSLVIRLWFGDAFGLRLAWQLGGVLGIIAILLFLLTAVGSALLALRRPNR